MPIEPQEVLEKLTVAIEEAKQTTRDLHAARGAALDVIKGQKQQIAQAIAEEVERVVGVLRSEARARMIASVEEVMSRLEADWRQRLGLPSRG